MKCIDDDVDRARSLLEGARRTATTNELLGLEWRIRVVLGLADDTAAPTEAERHRETAGDGGRRLADRVSDDTLRRRFTERAGTQIAAGRLS